MKRTWAGEVRNVSLLVASAVNRDGYRAILSICEGAKEDKSGWSSFLRHLVDRGLKGVHLVIADTLSAILIISLQYLDHLGDKQFRSKWNLRINEPLLTFCANDHVPFA